MKADEVSSVLSPIQFLDQEQVHHLPVPLARIRCCGLIEVEVLKEVVSSDPPMGRYEVIFTQTLRGRGAVPALMLLKLLASQPHRFASKDWLSTQMQQEMEIGALVRLDTMASQLRTLFCGSDVQEKSALRLRLVEYLRNGRGSGPGYRLAPYPLIWLDTDALTWNVEQAARMERFGQSQDAVAFWQRAYALASRGTFLPDDLYSGWAADKRVEIEGALRQSVHALSRLSLSLHGQAGEEEVMGLLRSYWLSHRTDEDALRPLMELLGRQERYQEAEACYQHLLSALREQDGDQVPDPRTQDLREFLRTKQIHREQKTSHRAEVVKAERTSAFFSPFSRVLTQASEGPGKEVEGQDMMNKGRRQLMQQALSATGTAMVASSPLLEQFARVLARPSIIDEATFRYLERRTAHYWRDRHSAMVTSSLLLDYVLEHLQKILTFLEWSLLPSERKRLCAFASGTAQLVGHLFFDLGDHRHARKFHEKAIQAAQEADNPALEAAAWGRMSFTWTYSGNAQKALPYIQQARSLAAGKTAQIVQAYLAAVEAEIQAMLHDREASLKALDEAEYINKQSESGEDLYWLRFDRSRLEGYQGACFRYFYRPEDPQTEVFLTKAQNALKDALTLLSPSMMQRRPALLIDLARTSTQQGEIEEACSHAIQAIIILIQLQSRTGMQRLLMLRQDLEPRQDTPYVKIVDEHLEALLPEWQRSI